MCLSYWKCSKFYIALYTNSDVNYTSTRLQNVCILSQIDNQFLFEKEAKQKSDLHNQ